MSHLYRHLRVHQIFGANTDVGKTILTTALVRASASAAKQVFYLKPVSTGAAADADDSFVSKFTRDYGDRVRTHCLYQYDTPVSPHLAAHLERQQYGISTERPIPSQDEFIASVSGCINDYARKVVRKADMYVETAGGVHSPTLSGITQADAYRPLRLPVILIGDSRLGGISSTISSYESLIVRGYTVDSVLLFHEDYYRNCEYLRQYFSKTPVRVHSVRQPPPKEPNPDINAIFTEKYFDQLDTDGVLEDVIEELDARHEQRIDELESMPRRTLDSIWWPFVQHGLVKDKKDVSVIDSAHGDFFSTYRAGEDTGRSSILQPFYDGSSSWWTQTFGHGQSRLALAAARAAGRYGHVMFPQATHAPALKLAERLLKEGPGKSWASRVFFSDDGSTAMEVAIKMALRAYTVKYGSEFSRNEKRSLGILGLKGSYHGDTIGAMDACEAGDGVYTCEWHEGKGYWFEPPEIVIKEGQPSVILPPALSQASGSASSSVHFISLGDIYDVERRFSSDLASRYREWIRQSMNTISKDVHLAALVLEPIVMGAGGMIFVDPLFQRLLVDAARSLDANSTASLTPNQPKLPVIFDEVFVGLYRLGMQSTIPLLGVNPDIAVYAKTLTGGVVPMAVTLASNAIFQAFLSENKADALLHGHSYTAHAVGCEVANETLAILDEVKVSDAWLDMQKEWAQKNGVQNSAETHAGGGPAVWSLWGTNFVHDVSHLKIVSSVMTLGTVLAIKLEDNGSGYRSQFAQTILASLSKRRLDDGFRVHFRTLGDVAYFMTSLNTPLPTIRELESRILEVLKESK